MTITMRTRTATPISHPRIHIGHMYGMFPPSKHNLIGVSDVR
jgi:hypothetical protein